MLDIEGAPRGWPARRVAGGDGATDWGHGGRLVDSAEDGGVATESRSGQEYTYHLSDRIGFGSDHFGFRVKKCWPMPSP